MYEELKLAILSKDHEGVRRVYEQVHTLNYAKGEKNITQLSLWIEAVCLVYLSFIDETETQYKECINHIGHAFKLNILSDDKEVNRLICLRLRCYEELFHYGVIYKEGIAKDRQTLLDAAITLLLTDKYDEVDVVNMLDVFTTSSLVDLLHNGIEDSVYSFLVSQKIIAYKVLKAIYIKKSDVEQSKRIEQCLNAVHTNLASRVSGLEKLCENEQRSWNGLNAVTLNPSWDIVSLGIQLPDQ